MPKRSNQLVKRKRRKPRIVRAGSLGPSLRRFRYVDVITLNPTAVAAAVHSFRANDLYDPDYTGAGHQPLGFDEAMTYYYHFTVLAARVKVTFVSRSQTSTTGNCIVGIEAGSATTATTAINDIYEQDSSIYKMLGVANSGQGIRVLTKRIDMNKYLHQDVLDEDSNAGSFSGSPAEQVFFHLYATPFDGTDPGTISAIVEIEYDAQLHEPKSVAGS